MGVLDVFSLMLIRTAGLPLQWPDGNMLFESELYERWKASEIRLQNAFLVWKTVLENEKDNPIADILLQKQLTNLRRLLRKGAPKRPVILDSYVSIHRPDIVLLADSWNQAFEQSEMFRQELKESFSVLQTREWQALQGVASNELLCRALLFSSHSLLHALKSFENTPPERWTKKERKTASSLTKFLFRACTKTTPFSRLATVGVFDGTENASEEAPFLLEKVHTTPNVVLLPFLYETLLKEPVFFQSLPLRLNPSLHFENNQLECLQYFGDEEVFQAMQPNDAWAHIHSILTGQGGAVPFPYLLDQLGTKVDAQEETLQSFVFQLVDAGLLEWIWPENGLSPGWCSALYNYLGFLPAAPMLTDAAFLLQWLRSAARVLPFQSVEEAATTQQEALEQCRMFFSRYQSVCPPIPPEQLFYEDVSIPVQAKMSDDAWTTIVSDIDRILHDAAPYRLGGLYARLFHFANREMHPDKPIPFFDFCKRFLQAASQQSDAEVIVNQSNTCLGALVQPFQTGDGKYKAVLNALYPGGGKMMARWLHLFPSDVSAALQAWWPEEIMVFPWQDWANSNFQPPLGKKTIAVPAGRVGKGMKQIDLNKVSVQRTKNELFLVDSSNGKRIVFSDLGLETPADKPPAMRILWHLGRPHISAGFLHAQNEWEQIDAQVKFRKRTERHSIVVARATWLVEKEGWQLAQSTDLDICFQLRQKLSLWKVPRYFFASTQHEKPRFFDACSPLLLLEFASMIRHLEGAIRLTEMLPTPDQWIVERNGQQYASEWVLEWKTSVQSNQSND